MKGRTLAILVAILAVLGGLALLLDASRKRETEGSGKLLFKEMDRTEKIDKIRIDSREGKESVLEKRGDAWIVASENGKPADQKAVNDLLEKLKTFHADQVVSTNPANQGTFQVDSTGTEVWLSGGGKEIAHFFVGKPGSDYASTYVRAANTDRVILVPEYLTSVFDRGDTWREKTLFSITQEDVKTYEFVSPSKGRLRLVNDGGTWKLEEPEQGTTDAQKASVAINSFGRLRAYGFADDQTPESAGTGADTTHVTVTTADGATHTLIIGAPAPSNRFYVQKQGSDQIVTIPRGAVNTMLAGKELYLTDSAIPPGGIRK